MSSLMIAVMLAVWLLLAVVEVRSATKTDGWRKFIRLLAAMCAGVGGLGFFGTALVATGGLDLLPNSFEWPIGYASDVVSTKDNYFVVPHTPSGRVQIYDSNWKFLRGWNVDASGGTFKLHITDTNRIHVVTARGQMHYVYDLNGNMVSSEKYSTTGRSYSSFPEEGLSYLVPTPVWLWTFTSPLYSWLTGAIGLGLFALNDKMKRKRTRASVPDAAGK